MTIGDLELIAKENGLSFSDEQRKKLSAYVELLRAKNQVVNLISRKDEENIFSKHILHSLTLIFPDVPLAGIPQGALVFDLGTGGGLPGIPIKIMRPDISLILCDSIAKKISSVNEMVQTLGLEDVRAITDRAENLSKLNQHKNKYDVVISRAVAPLDDLAKWSGSLLKHAGIMIALKGGNIEEEIQRTEELKFVKSAKEALLLVKGYDEFIKEEKKIVRVRVV